MGRLATPLLLVALASQGCVATPTHPDPRPFPGEVRLDGEWTSNWGIMTLRQSGTEVTGKVEHRNGALKGRINGDLLVFEWEQPSNRAEGVLAAKGKGWLRVSHDSEKMVGAWGYRSRYEGGGTWRAERSRDE